MRRSDAPLINAAGDLLAALEGVMPFLVGDYWPGAESDQRVAAAHAAIAKAKARGEA